MGDAVANYLKRGKDAEVRAEDNAKVRQIVEATLIDIEKRGNVIDFMVKAGWLSSKGGATAATSSGPSE